MSPLAPVTCNCSDDDTRPLVETFRGKHNFRSTKLHIVGIRTKQSRDEARKERKKGRKKERKKGRKEGRKEERKKGREEKEKEQVTISDRGVIRKDGIAVKSTVV